MKKILLSTFVLLFTLSGYSQATYSGPESVEFDYANNRWFISNHTGHNIITRSSATGALSAFATVSTSTGPHGLEIVNDTLYACAGATIKAYNINTGALIFSQTLAGASFLNGITHDNSGNLFITDYSANKIYRFKISNRTSNVFVSTGLSNPNGIIFDQANNRCVFVQWAGAFKQVLLSDSTTSTLLTSGLNQCDGITRDGAGNYFVSSWTGNKITRYTSTFTSPTTIVTGLSSPADIFYNVLTDTLGNPNSSSPGSTTYYYFGSAAGITDNTGESSKLNFSLNPNPVSKTAEINYELKNNVTVKIELYDIKGAFVKTILNENQPKGSQTAFFNRSGISGGTYMIKIQAGELSETKKIILSE